MHVCPEESSLRYVKGQWWVSGSGMHVLSASEKHNIELSAEAAHPMQGPSWLASRT